MVIILNAVQFSFFSIERIFEVLDSVPEIRDKENAIVMGGEHKNIEFKDVWFEYNANVPVLKNINLQINQGETLLLSETPAEGKQQ